MKNPIVSKSLWHPFKRSVRALATAAVICASSQSAHATLSYTFAELPGGVANPEGWTSVFGSNMWAKYDWWGSDGNLGDGWQYTETQLARSPEFILDSSGPINCKIIGTPSPEDRPVSVGAIAASEGPPIVEAVPAVPALRSADIPSLSIVKGGFMGIALRDVATDTYVLWKAHTGTDFSLGNAAVVFSDVGFSEVELAPFIIAGATYTLDFIDNDKNPLGGDHWASLGSAVIPGTKVLSTKKTILSFSAGGIPAVITGTNITLTLGSTTDFSNLAPTYTLSPEATGSPLSATVLDFETTNPQSYTVTAEDGSTQVYRVAIVGAPVTGILNVSFETTPIPGVSTLTGPIGSPGETWNQPTTLAGSGLLDSNANTTGAGWVTYNMGAISNFGTPALTTLSNGLNHGLSNVPFQFVINGLTANSYYDVYIASSNGSSTVKTRGTWSTPNFSSQGQALTMDQGTTLNTSTWVFGQNYVAFQQVLVNGAGKIILNGLSDPTFRLPLNGFQLVPTTGPPATDYSTWANRYPAMGTTDPALDADGDGLSNRYEYAFNLNPSDSASLNPITVPLNAKTGTLRYKRREKALTTLTYTVWTSTDLATWTQDNGATQTPGLAVAEVETVSVKLSPAVLAAPQLFVRVQIQ